jgi:hypothetical protein
MVELSDDEARSLATLLRRTIDEDLPILSRHGWHRSGQLSTSWRPTAR